MWLGRKPQITGVGGLLGKAHQVYGLGENIIHLLKTTTDD